LEYNYQETVSNNGRIMGITNYNDRTEDRDDVYRLDGGLTGLGKGA